MTDDKKFNGDCKVLQDLLRRFIELKGGEIQELPDNSISCDMALDTTLTLYTEPWNVGEDVYYGFIGYKVRKKDDAYINASNVQYLYEELNLAIAEIEHEGAKGSGTSAP